MSTAAPAKPRDSIDELTALRGIAALLVVVYHVSRFYRPFFSTLGYVGTLSGHGDIWVDFFFILSGFVMMHAYGGRLRERVTMATYRSFLWDRFTRIYPLYLVTLLGAVVLVGTGVMVENNPRGSLLANFLLIQSIPQALHIFPSFTWNHPAWSLSIEWCLYLVFPFLGPLLLRRSPRALGAIIVGCFASIAAVALLRHHASLPWGPFEFVVGSCICLLLQRTQPPPRLARVAARIFPLLALIVVALPNRFYDWSAQLVAVITFAGSIAAIVAARGEATTFLRSRALVFLGDISYSIYLNHLLLLFLFHWELGRLSAGLERSAEPRVVVPALAATFLLIVSVSWLTYRNVEQRARAWLRGLASAQPATSGAQGASSSS